MMQQVDTRDAVVTGRIYMWNDQATQQIEDGLVIQIDEQDAVVILQIEMQDGEAGIKGEPQGCREEHHTFAMH